MGMLANSFLLSSGQTFICKFFWRETTKLGILTVIPFCGLSSVTGIASAPVTPLLSSIPLKGRNYFVVTDNTPGPSSQRHRTQN